MKFLTKLVTLFKHVTPPRGEIRFVDYAEGDKLIRSGEWKLAIPEEDSNRTFNRVYVEQKLPEWRT